MHIPNHDLPVQITLAVIGGKWKPIILWHLGESTMRFSQLKKAIPNITQKMLTTQLREMEVDGLLERKVFAQVPPKVEYTITDYGKTLNPVLQSMCRWGEGHQNRNKSARQ